MQILAISTFLLLLFSSPALAGTCALCKQSLAVGGGDGLVRGIYYSIILIAGMPFCLAGFAIYQFIRGNKRRNKKEEL